MKDDTKKAIGALAFLGLVVGLFGWMVASDIDRWNLTKAEIREQFTACKAHGGRPRLQLETIGDDIGEPDYVYCEGL